MSLLRFIFLPVIIITLSFVTMMGVRSSPSFSDPLSPLFGLCCFCRKEQKCGLYRPRSDSANMEVLILTQDSWQLYVLGRTTVPTFSTEVSNLCELLKKSILQRKDLSGRLCMDDFLRNLELGHNSAGDRLARVSEA